MGARSTAAFAARALARRLAIGTRPDPPDGSVWETCCMECSHWSRPAALHGFPVCRRCLGFYSEDSVVRCPACGDMFRYPAQAPVGTLTCPTCGERQTS